MLNLIGVIVAFIVIIFLIRKKINFGLSLVLGSVIVGFFSLELVEPIEIPKAMIKASFYSFETGQIVTSTIELAVLMLLIFTLAKIMQESGAIRSLIDSLRTFFSKGGILGVIPAVYGLMPVPGGALFSAPMIDEEGDQYKLSKNQKNFLNIWFRHIWFPIFPISSAMILICSAEFSDIDIYTLIIANVPAFIASVSIGLIILKMFISKSEIPNKSVEKDYSGFIYLIPPLLPLGFYAVLQIIGFPQIRSFLIGILVSIVLMYFITKINKNEFLQIVKKSISWKLPLAIFGIMIFREIVGISEANQMIAEILGQLAIPGLLIVIIIPLILGFLTGYNLGAIALSYALVEPFFAPTGLSMVGFASIIFISSLAGYLVSPIHLCNVLSSDYLKTDSTRMYKMFFPAVFVLLCVQTVFVVLFL